MGKGLVIVFDFDRTIIDGDSDNWVVTQMGLNPLFKQLLPTMSWNSLMNKMMEELCEQGKTTEDIAECLIKIPLDPHIISAIREARAAGCELRIVSDANQFFIKTIMKHHGVLGYISEIYTNPTFVDEEGRLRITPYHDLTSASHGCNLCPPNMCKGLIMNSLREQNGDTKMFIYIGDGKNDYCPSLKLLEGDHVLPRKDYPLWDRIQSNTALIKAGVHEWSSAEELRCTLLQLISETGDQTSSSCNYSQLSSSSDHELVHGDDGNSNTSFASFSQRLHVSEGI